MNMLSSEEKYYREVVGYEDEYEDMNPRDAGVYSGYEHVKKVIIDSIWNTDWKFEDMKIYRLKTL